MTKEQLSNKVKHWISTKDSALRLLQYNLDKDHYEDNVKIGCCQRCGARNLVHVIATYVDEDEVLNYNNAKATGLIVLCGDCFYELIEFLRMRSVR